jgi:excisionase family DNA binding protein
MARSFSEAGVGMQIDPGTGELRAAAESADQVLREVQLSSDSIEIRVADRSAILPASVFRGLVEVLEILKDGRGVRIVPVDDELTTEEAARLLGVSRPHLVQLIDRGDIPCRKVGSRRRIRASDLAVYLDVRDAQRREWRIELDKLRSLFKRLVR